MPLPNRNWIEELVRRGDLAHRIGMLGGKILFAEPEGFIDKAGHLIYWDGQNRGRGTMERDAGQYDKEEKYSGRTLAAALYHRQVFVETGGFDESFFAFGDDADLGMRARLLAGAHATYPRRCPSPPLRDGRPLFAKENNAGGAQPPASGHQEFSAGAAASNPVWSARRFAWHAYAGLKRQGAAGRFVAAQGWVRLPFILLWPTPAQPESCPGL